MSPRVQAVIWFAVPWLTLGLALGALTDLIVRLAVGS